MVKFFAFFRKLVKILKFWKVLKIYTQKLAKIWEIFGLKKTQKMTLQKWTQFLTLFLPYFSTKFLEIFSKPFSDVEILKTCFEIFCEIFVKNFFKKFFGKFFETEIEFLRLCLELLKFLWKIWWKFFEILLKISQKFVNFWKFGFFRVFEGLKKFDIFLIWKFQKFPKFSGGSKKSPKNR